MSHRPELKLLYKMAKLLVISSVLFVAFQATNLHASNSLLTATPTPDIPTGVSCVDFSNFSEGVSVEGFGAVHPALNIQTVGTMGTAVVIKENSDQARSAYRSNEIYNNGIGELGGFAELVTNEDQPARLKYQFLIKEGYFVRSFSIQMLDFGDLNPSGATDHSVTLVAYSLTSQVDDDPLTFTSDDAKKPTSGDAGNLQETGDAIKAKPGDPGNYTFNVSSSNDDIVHLELQFSNNLDSEGSSDPKFALANLCFEVLTIPPTTAGQCLIEGGTLSSGDLVEGFGRIHENLNIQTPNTAGQAVVIKANSDADEAAYRSNEIYNNGIEAWGFAELINEDPASHPNNKIPNHSYHFHIKDGFVSDYFTVRMLDFGDLNPSGAISHSVTLVAYNSQDEVVDRHPLKFDSDPEKKPRRGSAGNMQIIGDASKAREGQPGNYKFEIARLEPDVVRFELQFSNNLDENGSSDPRFGLTDLGVCIKERTIITVTPDTPTPTMTPTSTMTPETPTPLTCGDPGTNIVAQESWDEHIRINMSQVDFEFGRPADADSVTIEAYWVWGGLPNQNQTNEKHSVTTSIGEVISDDYGDEELEGQRILIDSLSADFNDELLNITLDFAGGEGDTSGSHRSQGVVKWCKSTQ